MRGRRSCRRFGEKEVSKEALQRIVAAGRLSPASKGKDSTDYLIVDDKETLLNLSKSKDFGASFVKHAPAVIVVMGHEEISDVWIENASIAASNMLLAAEATGLGACWVQVRNRKDAEGVDAERNVREILGLGGGERILCMIAIGEKA